MSTSGFSHWTPEMVSARNAKFAPKLKIDTAVSLLAEARDREMKKKSQRLLVRNAPQGEPDEVCLTLPYPPSANKYWRSVLIGGVVRVLVSSEARAYKKSCCTLAAMACKAPMTGPLAMIIRVFRPMRRGDLSNRIKVVEDALQGAVFHDDDQIVRIEASRHDDKGSPRVEVIIARA